MMSIVRVNTETVLKLLLEHKTFFFRLLDEMDKHNGTLPLPFYKTQFLHELDNGYFEHDNDKIRFQQAMQPENLDYAGLLISLDLHDASLKWQNFVVEMFRHLDRSRLRKLSDPEFQSFHERLAADSQRLLAAETQYGSRTWHDTVRLVFQTLYDIQSRIRENTEALASRTRHLADIVENYDVSNLTETERSRQAFAEIRETYQHTILPMLQFLNEDEDIKGSDTPLRHISQIYELFNRRQEHATAQRILNIKNAIRSYSKDIRHIRLQMERYVRQDDQTRQQYNAIENQFNHLLTEIQQRQDGRLRGSSLTFQAAPFQTFAHFGSLKRRRFDAKINWQHDRQTILFNEYLRVQLDRQQERKKQAQVRVVQSDQAQQEARRQQQHEAQLKRAVKHFRLPENDQDIYLLLHQYLQTSLPEYTLSDLINGIEWLKILHAIQPQPIFGLHTLHYQNQFLRYHPLIIGTIK